MHDLQELGWDAWVAVLLQRAEWKEQKDACLFEMILSELSNNVNRMFQKVLETWFSVEIYVFGEITNITAPWKHTVPCRPYYHHFYEPFSESDFFVRQTHFHCESLDPWGGILTTMDGEGQQTPSDPPAPSLSFAFSTFDSIGMANHLDEIFPQTENTGTFYWV